MNLFLENSHFYQQCLAWNLSWRDLPWQTKSQHETYANSLNQGGSSTENRDSTNVQRGFRATPNAESGRLQRFQRENSFDTASLLDAPDLAQLLETAATSKIETTDTSYLHNESLLKQQLQKALRQLRNRVVFGLMEQDLHQQISLEQVCATLSTLADVSVCFCLEKLGALLQSKYGKPAGDPDLYVIAMGKLGGFELNVSSDIDLIYVYEQDGETIKSEPHQKSISNEDYFTRLARLLGACLSETTEDGFVFRVDVRLRPNGDSGPLVCSLAMLETYFVAQARTWERMAWCKARLINTSNTRDKQLGSLVQPFVFRKYLDFESVRAIADLSLQIQQEQHKKQNKPHRAIAAEPVQEQQINVKLSRGGIREIEFIAHLFQLMRAGREPSLQIKPTLAVLRQASALDLLKPAHLTQLEQAYYFLRRLEHGLQYQNNLQTHTLELNDSVQMAAMSAWMHCADAGELLNQLNQHRERVCALFDEYILSKQESNAQNNLEGLGESVVMLWQSWRASAKMQALSFAHQKDIDLLITHWASQSFHSPQEQQSSCLRLQHFLDAILKRKTYLALLAQYPQALSRLCDLLNASPWVARFLTASPLLLDDLLQPLSLPDTLSRAHFEQQVQARLKHTSDSETAMEWLREEKNSRILNVLIHDLAGNLPVEHVADALSMTADVCLETVLQHCWQNLADKSAETNLLQNCTPIETYQNGLNQGASNTEKRDSTGGVQRAFRVAPNTESACFDRFPIAIIGFGKLGGKELGYGSDLDLVFIYNDIDPITGKTIETSDHHLNLYTKLVRRINTWITAPMAAGVLYQTDLRLRPDGAAGVLVCSWQAFAQYQQQQAWNWEHQALSRARFVAGNWAVGAQFEQLRCDILSKPRDLNHLRQEITDMRLKMHSHHTTKVKGFDIKYSLGGLIDFEFCVQYWVLGFSKNFPDLLNNLGAVALAHKAGQFGITDPGLVEPAIKAYRELRHQQHVQRLAEQENIHLSEAALLAHQQAINRLYQATLCPDGA